MERITPRIATTAALLWKIYASLAGVLFLVLMAVLWRHHYGFKDTLYEAIVLTLSTISTGGFGAHAEGINFYHDALLEGILIVFMLLSGMNFTLHYWLLQGRPKVLWRDEEWRFYMGTFAIATLAVTGILARTGETVGGALRDSAFAVASLITSTGFATADFDGWPAASKLILLLVMVTGATAGSTGGGIKHIRVLMMFKLIHRQYRRAMHPRGVLPITVGYRHIPAQSILGVGAFIGTYIAIATAGALLLTAFDPTFASFPDAASASITALSNMGPGLGAVGPTHDFADVALISKTILSLEMWIGRLEIFAAILVFSPEAWKH